MARKKSPRARKKATRTYTRPDPTVTPTDPCINPHCRSIGIRKNRRSMGLCENCRKMLDRLIKSGQVESLQWAIDNGLALARRPMGHSRFPQLVGSE